MSIFVNNIQIQANDFYDSSYLSVNQRVHITIQKSRTDFWMLTASCWYLSKSNWIVKFLFYELSFLKSQWAPPGKKKSGRWTAN